MKKQFTVTIDEELIEQIKSNTNKGDVSRQVEEWIRVGLEKKSAKGGFVELLQIVKKLNEDRKNGLIIFNNEDEKG